MREGMADAVTALHAAVDLLLEVDPGALADGELLDLLRDTETATRRLAAVEHRQTAEVDRRGLAREHGCASTAVLLSQLLRLSAGEARARVKAADTLAPRRTFTGELLPPLHPVVAAAQAAGDISARHAAQITATIAKIPDAVDVGDTVAEIEAFLVEQARWATPEELGKITRHQLDVLDPDGTLCDSAYRDRHRDLTVHRRPDGSVHGSFDGTAEFGEILGTLLDVHAAPRPADEGERDLRSAGQRQHDGLLDAMRLAIRSGDLPTANGVLATVILTATAADWAADTGLATTGHGALIPVAEAKTIGRGETRLFPVVADDDPPRQADPPDPPPGWSSGLSAGLSPRISKIFKTAKPILAYGTTQRLFTEGQRLAMTARDRGCTFPGCTVPPLWCEADHVTDFQDTGRTSVDDGHLACPYHHRLKDTGDWTTTMIDQLPHWIAPTWLDPSQTPRRNRAHDPVTIGN